MTDYFALLDQSRRPWLDPEALKQAFHRKTLSDHPDAQRSAPDVAYVEAGFAQINDAYHTLQDPKLRLQHLLALEGHTAASRFDSVPDEIADLFPAIAAVTQDAVAVSQKTTQATSALSRSLVTAEVVQVRSRVDTLLERLRELQGAADAELQELSGVFEAGGADTIGALHRLYVRYSYVRRWIGQLEEHQIRLAA